MFEIVFKPYCLKCDHELITDEVIIEREEECDEMFGTVGSIHELTHEPFRIIEVEAEGHIGTNVLKPREDQVAFSENIVILPSTYAKMRVHRIKYIHRKKVVLKTYRCSICGGFLEIEKEFDVEALLK